MTLASPTFLFLCLVGICVGRLLPKATMRDVAFATLNLVAVYFALSSIEAAAVLLVLLCIVYFLGRLVVLVPGTRTGAIVGVSVFSLWATLFLLKDPGLLPAINPFAGFPVTILGISYITFRCISYLMEIRALPNGSLPRFISYITFFPAVTAGPIDRWRNYNATADEPVDCDVMGSLHRIANGFIKKFVLADNLASFSVFDVSQLLGSGEASIPLLWLAGALQLLLIYLDFSGYCDIVIGVSRLMGIKVMENFNYPFTSRNINEFWERWHISLSSLVKDYVFTPMTKQIFTKTGRSWQFPLVVASYFFVMILIALWHGTSTGFLLFGVAQGSALVAYQVWRKGQSKNKNRSREAGALAISPTVARMASVAATYLFVSYTLILWMSGADSWATYFQAMIGLN